VRQTAKVTIYSVQEIRYEKWLGTEKNDLDFCLQVKTRDPNTNRAQYRKKNWICYLATIANYYILC